MKSAAVFTLRPGKNLAHLLAVLPNHLIWNIESVSVAGKTVIIHFKLILSSEERKFLMDSYPDVIENVDSGRPAMPLSAA